MKFGVGGMKMSEIIQINENSWRIEDNGVRFFLLTGTKEALLIDSGMQTSNAREIAESLTELPLQILNTHADPDHISGNGMFESVLMNSMEEPLYRAHGGEGIIIPVKGGDIIDLGDRPLEIIELPGHTQGSVAILDINHRVLISGDSIQDGRIFMFGEHRNMKNYIESLLNLAQYEGRFDTIYPSHGTFPISPEAIPKLISSAKQILSGDVEGKVVDVFGKSVTLYQFDVAGFLCAEMFYKRTHP